jgi:hypothetical protein
MVDSEGKNIVFPSLREYMFVYNLVSFYVFLIYLLFPVQRTLLCTHISASNSSQQQQPCCIDRG